MRLYIETMDAVLEGFTSEGRIKLENEGWSVPNLQETRAIIHAAHAEKLDLEELIEVLERDTRMR